MQDAGGSWHKSSHTRDGAFEVDEQFIGSPVGAEVKSHERLGNLPVAPDRVEGVEVPVLDRGHRASPALEHVRILLGHANQVDQPGLGERRHQADTDRLDRVLNELRMLD